MDGACGMYGEEEMCVRGFSGETGAKKITWKIWAQVGGHITMNLQETGCEGGNWIDLAQVRDKWQALVNTVMNFQFL